MNAVVRRTGWALAFLVLAVFFQSFLRQPTALLLTAALAAYAVLSAVKPYAGLLVFAAAGPLASMIYTMGRGAGGNAVFAEGIALAFLAGWTARQVATGEALRVPSAVRWPAILLALLAAASGAVHWFGIRAEAPLEPLGTLLDWYVLRDYPLRTPGVEPIAAAVVFFSSMILVLAAAHLCAGDRSRRAPVLVSMVLGAAAAATYSIRRLVQIASASDRPLAALVDHLLHTRISVHYGDKNAAGSYFTLVLLIALGFITRRRILTVLACLIIGGALWLTGSRVAIVAVFVSVAALAAIKAVAGGSRRTRIIAAAGLVAVIIGGALLYTWYPQGRNFKATKAFEIRAGLVRAGLQMSADHPVFGVGLGRFYRLSADYAGETLAKFGFARENAHNNLIQILAELGITGLVAFLALVGGALAVALRDEQPRPLHVSALVAGIVAYVITTLGGHPLVVPDATYPFWLAIGLAAAPMREVPKAGARANAVVLILAFAIVVSVPFRAQRAIAGADLEHVSSGFSMWQGTGDDWRYRFMSGRAMFYVPATANAVQVQLRGGVIVRKTVEVTVLADGREVNRVLLPSDDQWRNVRFLVKPPAGGGRFVKIDLVAGFPGEPPFTETATANNGLILVRRPVIER